MRLFYEKLVTVRLVILFAAFGVGSSMQAAEPSMTRIVTRMISPSMPADAFAARPKTMYLAGKRYARLEEELDVQHGIHGLIVTSEPDSWMINLADKTARHFVDPGPTFVMRAPVFWVARPKGEPDPDQGFKELEFGEETQFFRQRKAREIGLRNIDGKSCKGLSVKMGSREVILFLDADTKKPHQIDLLKDGKLDFSIRYLSYAKGLPFQKSLFLPPNDVKVTEGK